MRRLSDRHTVQRTVGESSRESLSESCPAEESGMVFWLFCFVLFCFVLFCFVASLLLSVIGWKQPLINGAPHGCGGGFRVQQPGPRVSCVPRGWKL